MENRTYLYISVLISNLVSFAVGIAVTWTSPMIPRLKLLGGENPLWEPADDNVLNWIVSLFPIGAVLAPFFAGYASEKVGRKLTLFYFVGLPMAVSFIILAFAQNVPLFYCARFVAGFGAGSVFTVLPMYLGEIAEDNIRGAILTFMSIFIVAGQLMSYTVGAYTSIVTYNLISAVAPLAFLTICLKFLPESPYYLAENGYYEEARDCLRRLHPYGNPEKELQQICVSLEESKNNTLSLVQIMKSKSVKKAFLITWGLMAFQQLSGIGVVIFYTQTIFASTGSEFSPEISSIIVGAVQVFGCCLTPFVIDRLGRRIMLLFSILGVLISDICLGVYFWVKASGYDMETISWLPILFLVTFIWSFNLGIGPIPWTALAELFPDNMKKIASISSTSFIYLLFFIVSALFVPVSAIIGTAAMYLVYAGFTALAVVFIYFYVPETKGKSFQEIQDMLKK